MSEQTTNTPATAQRFTPVDTLAAASGQTPQVVQSALDASVASQTEKTMQVLDGYQGANAFFPEDARTGSRKEENQQSQSVEQTQQEVVAAQKAEEARLYANKYKDVESLEKGYKELERQFHGDERVKKVRDEFKRAKEEAERYKKENELLKAHVNPDDDMTDARFNQMLAEDPAAAIRARDAWKDAQTLKSREADRQKEDLERMKEDINANIKWMEGEYPEFATVKTDIAAWMKKYDMDSGRIMADKTLFQDAYRDFVDAHTDYDALTQENLRAGQALAHDKLSQMPTLAGSGSMSHPINNPSNNRFTPIGQQQVQQQPETVIDPLDFMERGMKIGGYADVGMFDK